MYRHTLRNCGKCVWRLGELSYSDLPDGFSIILAILLVAYGCSTTELTDSADGPSPALSPEKELETFKIQRGLKVELVVAEPMIEDPVIGTFDEDGRLWVVEMRGYMPNIEGEGEREPVGRVSVLEDTDGDGEMDISTVYLDSLIMPRALAVVEGGILVVAKEALWIAKDEDGDQKADSKTLVDPNYAESMLPEHAPNGLWRGIDNWYYNAKSRLRYRLADGQWISDSTEFRGQWGISHDDEGRLYYNYNWSQLHADLAPPNYLTRNINHTPVTGIDQGLTLDRRIYPIGTTPAVNRGYIPGILDEDKKLKEFTAACSPLVYRGTALPDEFHGNVFVCEPSGNLIKRNVVESAGLNLAAHDPHPGTEFFASTDERFRPVHLTSGPDGALYVVDMYRGLVQHKAYITPYLREQTLSRKLVQPIHYGRIWRVVPQDWEPRKQVKLSRETSAQLVDNLSNPDGWYRDMAQRLLVERKDKTVMTQLTQLALNGREPLGRFHALWTLEGLNNQNTDIYFKLVEDPDPLVNSTAVRLLERFARRDKNVRVRLEKLLEKAWAGAPLKQILQISFTAAALNPEVSHELLMNIATRYDTSDLIRDAIMSSIGDQEMIFMQKLLASPQWTQSNPSREIFLETLASSIARKRDPSELKTLLAMLDSKGHASGWREKAIVTGLSIQGYTGKIKPVHLDAAPNILSSPKLNIPASTLDGLTALFEWPGSVTRDSIRQPANALTKQEKEQFALGRKFYLTSCSGCHGTDGEGINRFAPPLRGSEWVIGDERRLSLIVLHGIEGPLEVAGKRYGEPEILPVMPGQFTLDNNTLAAILTYIRNEWGNNAGAVSANTVGQVRLTNQGRLLPWTAEQLNDHMKDMQKETP
jgi:mono/diheme cytochrome c family protein/glucose/arabinose dehydrogenase